jgi:septal ring factor EnvC (AmiA/AmiB activator)
MANRKAAHRDSIIKDWHFWTTVGMFAAAVILIIATVFLVVGTNQLNEMTDSYSETFSETAEDISAAAADIEEATAGLSQLSSYLQAVTTQLEAIDQNVEETIAALTALENTTAATGAATVDALEAVAALKVNIAQILSSFEYMTFYWCHYCCPCTP